MSLEACMKSFIDYKLGLDEIERSGLDDTTEETYEKLFMKLRDETTNFKSVGICTTIEGEKRCNTNKNRYKDIVPYDQTRVKLKEGTSDTGSDYLNASHIQGVAKYQRYIAAQGPMPETVSDFWRMLWENDVRVVLMACNEYEGIPRKLRCQRYWAVDADETLQFGDIFVRLLNEEKTEFEEYTVRHLRATRGDESRNLVHLHYTAWPDRGTPKCIPSIVNMIERMREIQPASQTNASPVVVHCSAGCGRTGTIIVIDYVCNLLKFGKLSTGFSLYNIVFEMRKQRMAIVQSLEQYVFVHDVIVELFTKHLGSISCNTAAGLPTVVSSSTDNIDPKLPPIVPRKILDSLPPCDPSSDISEASRPPKPPTPKPPTAPRKQSADQGSMNSVTALYAVPGNRSQAVADVRKKVSVSSVSSTNDYAEIDISSDSSSKFTQNWSSNDYAEIEIKSPPTATSGRVPDYEYADLNAMNKWSLQHIARGVHQDTTAFGGVDGAYSMVNTQADRTMREFGRCLSNDSDSDDDFSAPAVPPKPQNFTDNNATSSINTGTPASAGALFSKIMHKIKPQVSAVADVPSSASVPTRVICYGSNISFPNRIERPKYGPRQFIEKSYRL